MMIEVELTDSIAKALLLSITTDPSRNWKSDYKDWAWWEKIAQRDVAYTVGSVQVRLVQVVAHDDYDYDDNSFGGYAAQNTEMVWEFFLGDGSASQFYRLTGTASSYGDAWSDITFKRVTPTEKVIRQYV